MLISSCLVICLAAVCGAGVCECILLESPSHPSSIPVVVFCRTGKCLFPGYGRFQLMSLLSPVQSMAEDSSWEPNSVCPSISRGSLAEWFKAQKGIGSRAQREGTCLAFMRPWAWSPRQQKLYLEKYLKLLFKVPQIILDWLRERERKSEESGQTTGGPSPVTWAPFVQDLSILPLLGRT